MILCMSYKILKTKAGVYLIKLLLCGFNLLFPYSDFYGKPIPSSPGIENPES